MKSRRLFIGIFFLGLISLLPGCSTNSKGRAGRDELPEELSLKADRSAFQEMRTDVPEETRIANDEKAYFANLFADPTRPPSKLREQFSRDVRRIRDQFEKLNRKSRETYGATERKNREAFITRQKREREEYTKTKHDHKENSQFYSDLDTRRREYFATEREKREKYESNQRQARRDFDDYTRSRQQEFEEQFRNYSRQYADDQKLKAQQKRSGVGANPGTSPSVMSIVSGQSDSNSIVVGGPGAAGSGPVPGANGSSMAGAKAKLTPEEQAQALRFQQDIEDFKALSGQEAKSHLQSGSGGK